MTLDEIIKGLEKIAGFFKARADMAVGDAKMLLLNWMKCAQEAAELIATQKAERERETTSSVSAGGAATFPRGEGSGEAQGPRVMTLEEVMARRGEPAWLDAKSSKGYKGYVLIYDVQEGMGITGVRIGVTKPGHITIWPAKELYGVKWRCWTARPTDEQREATPWINQ